MSRGSRLFLDLHRLGRLIFMLARFGQRLLRRRLAGTSPDAAWLGAELRQLFESMGMTYVKLGQFLAMRFDVLPEALCRELARLFDAVPTLPAHVVRGVIEREFARPVEALFPEFDWTCVAAASVAQVHKARTLGGDLVAVKVQRPGVETIFAADIRNFRRLAGVGDRLRLLGTQSLVDAVDEFEEYTTRELDFTVEGATAERLRRLAGPFEDAPRIHWDLTTARVLTMEFVQALPLSTIIELVESGRDAELAALAPGLDLGAAIRHVARASMRQLFVTGFFHADPHPGNILIRDDGTAVFIDFGIFGSLPAERRETVASYIEHVALGNVEQSYRHFVRLLEPTDHTDHQRMRREIHDIMRRWHQASQNAGGTVAERHLGKYIGEFIATMRRCNARMSFGMLLFWRALMTLDATALRFKGHFDLLTELRDFFTEIRPTPLERAVAAFTDHRRAVDLADFARAAPASVHQLVDDVARSQFHLRVRTTAGRAGAAGARALSFALVSASLAVLALKGTTGPMGEAGQMLAGAAATTLALLAVTRRARA